MHLFLCGGGSGQQTAAAYEKFRETADLSRPLLYIPLAMEPEQYDDCLAWFTAETAAMGFPAIRMVRSGEELAGLDFSAFGAVFLGGGNTYKLLYDLKRTGAFEKLQAYLESGGAAFGGSAGAIIFGETLQSCNLDDENLVGLADDSGFDALRGVSLLCHYTDRTPEQDAASRAYLLELSRNRRVFALPEEVTLYVHGGRVEVFGDRAWYRFENGAVTECGEDPFSL